MRRLFITLALLLVMGSLAQSQTTVNLTVQDTPDNQTWNNGIWAAQLQRAPGDSDQTRSFKILSGGGNLANQSGSLSTTGTASMSLPANTNIAPTGTTWQFVVCPDASAGCFSQNVIVGTSSPQALIITPNSIRINLQVVNPPIWAYADTEILNAVKGSTYFNEISLNSRICTTVSGNICTVWGNSMGGVPGGSPIQTQVNNNGVFGGTPCENFGNITVGPENVDCDWHPKGVNPYVDITRYGARTCNPNATPCASGITASINNGSTSATISSASTFINGDGVVIYGAGPSQSLTTPTGLAVAPSLAVGGTGTGIVNPSALGSTTRCYKIIARDTGGGFTAASSEVCNAIGQATLGAVTINLTSCSRATVVVTCTASAATPLLVGGGPQLGEVYIGGNVGTIDNSFRGFHEVQSASDSTHFTFTDNLVNAANGGVATSTTGGTATFYVANHLTWNAVTGAWLYYIYEGSAGAETLIGVSRPNQTVNGNTDTTFDDFGPGLMSGYIFPPWIPTTPPVSPQNDNLSTTIVSGAGTTTLTLFNAAGATVSGAGMRLDASVGIIKAAAVASVNGPLYIPNDPSAFPFVVNNFCDLRPFQLGIYQSGSLFLNETLAIGSSGAPVGTVRWTGGQNTAFNTSASSVGWGPAPANTVKEASPGVYDGGGNQVTVDGISFFAVGPANGALLFLVDGVAGAFNVQFKNGVFGTGSTTGDLMGFGLYIRNVSGIYFDRMGFGSGAGGDGNSHNTPFFCSCGDVHFTSIYHTHRGFIYSTGGGGGGQVEIANDHYNGGGTPLITTIGNGANVQFGGGIIMDTVGHSCLAMLTGKNSVVNPSCNPSGTVFTSPAITGTASFTDRASGPTSNFSFINSLSTNQTVPTSNGSFAGTQVVDQIFSGPGAIAVSPLDAVIITNAPQVAPVCTVQAGGSIAVGTYVFFVVPFWQNGGEGVASASSNQCTTSTGNQTIALTWTSVPGNPIGYRVFAGPPGSGAGYQTGAGLVTSTSFTFTSLVGGFQILPTVPLGGPTMLMPGTQGIASGGPIIVATSTFVNLGTVPTAGTFKYCTDCITAATCAGSGTGHMAVSNGTNWTCQ